MQLEQVALGRIMVVELPCSRQETKNKNQTNHILKQRDRPSCTLENKFTMQGQSKLNNEHKIFGDTCFAVSSRRAKTFYKSLHDEYVIYLKQLQ
jgi:hypothetical protein